MYPFSLLYGYLVEIRNQLYTWRIISIYYSKKTIISVGNLSVGGTGKTPCIEYLIEALGNSGALAVISRGYGRNSKGLLTVHGELTANEFGDEPCQIKAKYPQLQVFVSEKRRDALAFIDISLPTIQAILLDDAYQHIQVSRGVNILISTYTNPFFKDYMIPTGSLREFRSNAKRADIILFTKCPIDFHDMHYFVNAVNKYASGTPIYFTYVAYKMLRNIYGIDIEYNKCLLVTSIANPLPIVDYLVSKNMDVVQYKRQDHAQYDISDIKKIVSTCKINSIKNIITTSKDEVKLRPFLSKEYFEDISIFVLDIEMKFFSEEEEQSFLSHLRI